METTPIKQQIFNVLEAIRYETDLPTIADYYDRIAVLAEQSGKRLDDYIDEFEITHPDTEIN